MDQELDNIADKQEHKQGKKQEQVASEDEHDKNQTLGNIKEQDYGEYGQLDELAGFKIIKIKLFSFITSIMNCYNFLLSYYT